jgi:hypothetical protein
MTIPPVSEPYKQTVGAFIDFLQGSIAGNEPTDPVKVAKVIVDLTQMSEPPFRLLIGTDAVSIAASVAKTLAESDEKWRHLSESVGFYSDNA